MRLFPASKPLTRVFNSATMVSASLPCSRNRHASAPAATLLAMARYPQCRPITSTTKTRLWARAVSLMRSQALTMVFSAVSTPMAVLVQPMSLSMLAGIPTTGTPCSFNKASAPVRLPFPPMTIKPSASLMFFAAFARPSGVRNSVLRALPSTVPP